MTITLPTISEVHTSELTASCQRKIMHKHLGQFTPEIPGAMFKGLLFGKVCEFLHTANMWDTNTVLAGLSWAADEMDDEAERDGRVLSDSVRKNITAHCREVGEVAIAYADRFGERFKQCELIGVEVPVRWTFQLPEPWADQEPVDFASHIDLLLRDTNGVFQYPGAVLNWDWKNRKDAPTFHYLARQPQLSAYFLAVKYGHVMLDGEWTCLDAWSEVAWIHAPSLKVYKRATTKGGIEYKKGDTQPDENVIRWCEYAPRLEDRIIYSIAEKVVGWRHGLFPMNPDPVGCSLCECQEFCERFDIGETT